MHRSSESSDVKRSKVGDQGARRSRQSPCEEKWPMGDDERPRAGRGEV